VGRGDSTFPFRTKIAMIALEPTHVHIEFLL
jgi:hypothetical protein